MNDERYQQYKDRVVRNVIDEDALITTSSHTEYWQNARVFMELGQALLKKVNEEKYDL